MKRALQGTERSNDGHLYDMQFLWSLFKTPHLGMVITDLLGNIVQVNQTAEEKLFGSGKPHNFYQLLQSENEQELMALKQGQSDSEHCQFSIETENTHYGVHGVRQQSALRYVWTITPISDGKCNVQVKSHDEHYQFLVENTFELIFRSNDKGELIFCNNLFQTTFGYSYEEARLLKVNALFLDADSCAKTIDVVTQQGQCKDATVHLREKQGGLIIGKLNAQLENDGQSGFIITWKVLDVTKQHDYELSLMQKNEDLAKVNAQMEKFLYSTSHDLRSPLTSILGLVNLLRIERPNRPVLTYVDKIETSVNKLDEIIKDIMRFSKNSYQRLQSEKIFLEILIWKIIRSFNGLPNAKRISFEVLVKENETFYSDSERLEMIINNIVRNAIIFTDANKVKPFVTIKAKALDDDLTIEIMDNGIGIGKTHLSSIFNMFYRATDRSQGAGLGLYVVKEAVERLKGSIAVESEIGFGSIFKINIPNDSKGRLVSKKMRLQEGRV